MKGWDEREAPKPTPREPWNRERDDAAYRNAAAQAAEAVAQAAPDPIDLVDVLRRFVRQIVDEALSARGIR